MKFCTNCGGALAGGSFCVHCGVRAGGSTTPSSAPAPQNVAAGVPAQPMPPAKKSSAAKILLTLAVVFLIFAGAVIAGVVYIGYRVEHKVKDFARAHDIGTTGQGQQSAGAGKSTASGDGRGNAQASKALDGIGGLMDRLGLGGPPPDPYADLPKVSTSDAAKLTCPAAGQQEHPFGPGNKPASTGAIPFREGLVLNAAWGRDSGDVEVADAISAIRPDFVTIADSGTYFASDDDKKGNPGAATRDVCWQDLQNSHGYVTGYSSAYPRVAFDTTSSFLSAAAFGELKTQGKTDLKFLVYSRTSDGDHYLHWQDGEMTRAEPDDVPYPIIVNDQPTTLPAIHARGTMLTVDKKARLSKGRIDDPLPTELLVLDDPNNPIVLLYRMEDGNFRIQLVRIAFPPDTREKPIEDALAKNKRAVVYGIYFDFNSDTIKPESEPVLKQIAQAMNDNPDWKLTVEGHTDNIGGDAYNLDLSKRRSASVKQALVDRYRMAPERLTTSGYGASRPVDTNDTLEGRARNRRVELTRE